MSRLMADGVVVDTETIANAYGKVANAVTQLDLQAVASTEISPSS
jgi:hypothetical protein